MNNLVIPIEITSRKINIVAKVMPIKSRCLPTHKATSKIDFDKLYLKRFAFDASQKGFPNAGISDSL